MRYLILLFVLLVPVSLQATAIDVIPAPRSMDVHEGAYVISDNTTVGCSDALEGYAEYIVSRIYRSSGIQLEIVPLKKADIKLRFSEEELPAEGYTMSVGKFGISIEGADAAGVFYGLQTLLHLLPAEIWSDSICKDVDWTVPYVSISDAPERPWRGMMLDVARYFYNVDFVKKYIDMMSMYKLNKLQLHLIDDSGWRVEIKKYPELTSVGAWAGPETARLGGYYTQEELRDLVKYASFRNIEIIPEVEFPAHILSAVVAYPWLSCKGEQHQIPEQHFISRDLICAGKESTYEFLENVLEEIVSMFPSDYVNIGGDEAVYDRWKECPYCQDRMRRESLEDVSHLQGYMTDRVTDMLKARGKTAVGWEEMIMRGRLKNKVTALIWHDVADSIKAAESGHKAILTPATHMYFDFPESKTPGEVKSATWMPPISVEKCYSMPINDFSDESTVIGVQGCFWSDQFIHGNMLQEIGLLDENRSERYAEYLTFPRLLALSEVAWKKESERNWNDFRNRLKSHFSKLDYAGCGYRVPEPYVVSEETEDNGSVTFTLEPSVPGSRICYTVDGTYPTVHSQEYSGPVNVLSCDDFRAITVLSASRYSLPVYSEPDYSGYSDYGAFVSRWTPAVLEVNRNIWKTECTGSFRGNGTYEVTLVYSGGEGSLEIGKMELLKRDQIMCEDIHTVCIDNDSQFAMYEFTLDEYEAGTPFFLSFHISGFSNPLNEGLVFIRRKQ